VRWEAAGTTHVGRVRRDNEDAFRLNAERGVFLVADGMGGHAAGEIASALAADRVLETLENRAAREDDEGIEEVIRAAFLDAHRAIKECCDYAPHTVGMGTTLTAVLLRSDGRVWAGHIGDSRLYLLRGTELRQISRDHTWVQQELDAGRILPEDADTHPLSHILTRVLTADEPAEPDVTTHTVGAGDSLLLCSDGLHNMLDGQSLLDILVASHDPADIVDRLIEAANRRGGRDNITAVIVRIS
jgi:PPM family protein phosphatase